MKSVFIEGLDGSGKSTQIELLKKYLESKKYKVTVLREPGGSQYYEKLREIHYSEIPRPPMSDALLTGAGRAANIQLTKELLNADQWVLSDRAYPSTFAYQHAQGVEWEDIATINKLALDGFVYDYKFIIDTPVDVASERITKRQGAKRDHWEQRGKAFFQQIRKNYLRLAEEDKTIIVLDGSLDIETIHSAIVSSL